MRLQTFITKHDYPQINPPCLGCNCSTAIKNGYKPCPILDAEWIASQQLYDNTKRKN